MLSAIVATANKDVIGKTGGIPWYLPADLRHFKEITMGRPIIMGRVTHESIGRALPGRRNIVITRKPDYRADDCEVVASLEEAINLAGDDAFIIGGESIYQQALPKVGRLYITKIEADIAGDKFFNYDPGEWQQLSSEKHQPDEKNPYAYEFLILERKKKWN